MTTGTLWELASIYDEIVDVGDHYGAEVLYTDLTEIHTKFPKLLDTEQVAYTGLCDGRRIYLHKGSSPVDEKSRAWNVLHLIGHMLQWHMPATAARRLGIRYFGRRARRYAVGNFFHAPTEEFGNVLEYELTADRISLGIVSSIMSGRLTKDQAQRDLARFAAADLYFIVNFYQSYDKTRAGKWRVPSPEELEKLMLPYNDLPGPDRVQFKSLSMLSVPVLRRTTA